MRDLFDTEDIWYISLPGLGKAYLSEHNLQPGRTVICRGCRGDIKAGAGFRFVPEHKGNTHSAGYLCRRCLLGGLRGVARWHFDESNGVLFKANGYARVPVRGERLADLFDVYGAAGLMDAVREATSSLIIKS
jgi:hypothetical protein